jgi:hypothetical protein
MKATIYFTPTLSGDLSPRTIFQKIQDALFEAVYLVAGTIPVAWENVEYTPTLGVQHWQVYLSPRMTSPASMGISGLTEHRGIVQVNVRTPISEGPSAAVAQADRLATYFRRGISLGAAQIRIVGVSRGSILIDKAWATLPVTIQWRCHSPE